MQDKEKSNPGRAGEDHGRCEDLGISIEESPGVEGAICSERD
ncbi:hypothetical protein [Thalassobacillus devorans]|nr:hypothetical protein [Thalassobacillus devorans]